jgi:hypothetical protein
VELGAGGSSGGRGSLHVARQLECKELYSDANIEAPRGRVGWEERKGRGMQGGGELGIESGDQAHQPQLRLSTTSVLY